MVWYHGIWIPRKKPFLGESGGYFVGAKTVIRFDKTPFTSVHIKYRSRLPETILTLSFFPIFRLLSSFFLEPRAISGACGPSWEPLAMRG